MSKGKIYKINRNVDNYNKNNELIKFILSIVAYAFVLTIAGYIFKGIYIENFFYALLASLIINCLNYTIKPLLIFWTLPLSIVTFGIGYPIVNMIILYLCSFIMGSVFVVQGFFNVFFIAIFISALKIIFDKLITNKLGG